MNNKTKMGWDMGKIIGYSLLAATALTSLAANAQVKSKTAEEFAQYGPEDAYWVFTVTCEDDTAHKVQRKTDGELWCAVEVSDFCDANRDVAADKVCSADFAKAVGASQASTQAQQAATQSRANEEAARKQAEAEAEKKRADAAALKERQAKARQEAEERAKAEEEAKQAAEAQRQLSIQEELLKIEQEKLDLRRQELELQERAVEIQELLDKEETEQ